MDFGLDVRPTLSRPTGVGTYVLGLAQRLPLLAPDDRFHYFSASIKERYPARPWPPNVRLVDRRLPVRGLNAAWNRAGVAPPRPPRRDHPRPRPLADAAPHPEPQGQARRHRPRPVLPQAPRHGGGRGPPRLRGPRPRPRAPGGRRVVRVGVHRLRGPTPPRRARGEDRGHAARRSTRSTAPPPPTTRSTRPCDACGFPGAASCTSGARRSGRTWSTSSWPTSPSRARRRLPPLVLVGPGSDWAQGGSRVGPQILATGYLDKHGPARAHGRVRPARPALARGGLRPARGRGHGRGAARGLLARARPWPRSRATPPASSTRTTRTASPTPSSACSRTTPWPRTCAAGASSAAAASTGTTPPRARSTSTAGSLAASPARRRYRRPRARRPTHRDRPLPAQPAPSLARGRRPAGVLLQRPSRARPGARPPRHLDARPRRRERPWPRRGRSASSPGRRPRDGIDVFFSPAYSCPLSLAVPARHRRPRPVLLRPPPGLRASPTPSGGASLVGLSLQASSRVPVCSDFTRREIARLFPSLAREGRARAPRPRRRPPASRAARRGSRPPGDRRALRPDRGRHPQPPVPARAPARDGAAARAATRGSSSTWSARTAPTRASTCRAPSAALGLGDRVRFSGFVDDQGLADRYAAADAAVFLSEYEGFGLPALEAAARGVPLVVASAALARRDLRRGRAPRGPPGRDRGRGGPRPRPRATRRLRERLVALRPRPGRPPLLGGGREAHPRGASRGLRPLDRRQPAVAVVVVSYEAREALLASLRALREHASPPVELVVVDNASARRLGRGRPRPASRGARDREPGQRGLRAGLQPGLARDPRPPRALPEPGRRGDAGRRRRSRRISWSSRPEVGVAGPRTRSADGAIQVSTGPDLGWLAEARQRRLVRGVARREPRRPRRGRGRATRSSTSPTGSRARACSPGASALEAVSGLRRAVLPLRGGRRPVPPPPRRGLAGSSSRPPPRCATSSGRSMAKAPERARLEYHRSHLLYYRKHNGAARPARPCVGLPRSPAGVLGLARAALAGDAGRRRRGPVACSPSSSAAPRFPALLGAQTDLMLLFRLGLLLEVP